MKNNDIKLIPGGVEISGEVYKIGDRIKLDIYGNEYTGEVKFGLYNDAEGYSVCSHLGFYITYIKNDSEYEETLSDAIQNKYIK